MADHLQFLVRTPLETVLDEPVRGLRLPAETGQVGIRPGAEPMVLVVEPGLIVVRADAGSRFAATAGGLLESHRVRCVLYTPFAVVGEQDVDVLSALDRVLSTPDGELAARRRLGELEQRIMREVRRREPFSHGAGP